MSALTIHRDREHERWIVMRRNDDFARVVAAFDSLREAEFFVVEHGDPIPEVRT